MALLDDLREAVREAKDKPKGGSGQGVLRPGATPAPQVGQRPKPSSKSSTSKSRFFAPLAASQPVGVQRPDAPEQESLFDTMLKSAGAKKTPAGEASLPEGTVVNVGGPTRSNPDKLFNSENPSAQTKESQKNIARGQVFSGGGGPVQIKTITQEEFDKLPVQQQRAIQFNTLLHETAGRDAANAEQYTQLNPDQQGSYSALHDKMFGTKSGDLIAPETLALLESTGLDVKGATLEDFTSLRAGVRDEDFKYLGETARPLDTLQTGLETLMPGTNAAFGINRPEVTNREDYVNEVSYRTANLEQTLARGKQILLGFSGGTRALTQERASVMGAGGQTMLSNGDNRDEVFNAIIEAAGDPTVADELITETLVEMQGQLKPEEMADLFRAADTASTNASRYKIPLAATAETSRTPEQFRKLFGLD